MENIPLYKKIELSRLSLKYFVGTVFPNYTFTFAHDLMIEYIEAAILGQIRKLQLRIPPQIGKTTLDAILAPAWAAGVNIDEKIACVSYNKNFASKHNQAFQNIYSSKIYNLIFPNNFCVSNITAKDVAVKRNDKIDFIDGKGKKRGQYTSFGIGSGITGENASLIIVDDLIKDVKQAHSKTRRDSDWDSYNTAIITRMLANSRIIVTGTPWNPDDYMSRILAQPDADEWELCFIPSIKQNKHITIENENWKFELLDIYEKDPRNEGESIWEERRPVKDLIFVKETDPFVFEAMYQVQPPTARQGGQMWFSSLVGREDKVYQETPKIGTGYYIVSFDNNVEPVACTVSFFENRGSMQASKLTFLKEYQIGYKRTDSKKVSYELSEMPIEDICKRIVKDFGATSYVITGDCVLNERAHGMRGKGAASIIRANLQGSDRIPKSNPNHSYSHAICNRAISLGCIVISSDCKQLWAEINSVQADESRHLLKDAKNQYHVLDCLRYSVHLAFNGLFNERMI